MFVAVLTVITVSVAMYFWMFGSRRARLWIACYWVLSGLDSAYSMLTDPTEVRTSMWFFSQVFWIVAGIYFALYIPRELRAVRRERAS